ncbi:hypothetical protein STRIP9103_06086, partial [Streptomyces ipomoeae 91-03]
MRAVLTVRAGRTARRVRPGGV